MKDVKEVVSISIGSSKRDHEVHLRLAGQDFRIWREGTDGDIQDAIRRLNQYDGKVDAFGLGGIGLYFNAAGHTYCLRDGMQFAEAARVTPLLDGMGLKGAVEGDIVRFMEEDLGLSVHGKRVLMTSCVDRWGMAMAFDRVGCQVTYGDLLYALDIPIMLHSRASVARLVKVMCPLAMQLPFRFLYPYESDHTTKVEAESKHAHLYREADIIAGDYKYVKQYMPTDMEGKWVVTNTTTVEDLEFLRGRGVELIVTTTPRLEGRSFGTNVIEATLVALNGSGRMHLTEQRYLKLLKLAGFTPGVNWLQKGE